MTNDVDTLATALYATTDDMLKEHPDLAPWHPPVGITPRLSDAELVTLATMQAILGYTSEAKWLRHARAHLRHLFPYLPQQPGYNKTGRPGWRPASPDDWTESWPFGRALPGSTSWRRRSTTQLRSPV